MTSTEEGTVDVISAHRCRATTAFRSNVCLIPMFEAAGTSLFSVEVDDRTVRAVLDTGAVRTSLVDMPSSARQVRVGCVNDFGQFLGLLIKQPVLPAGSR